MYLGKHSKMKKLALVVGIILFLSTVGVSQEEELKVRVIVRRANVREKPTLKSDIIAQVRRGRVLVVDGKEGEWYRIRLPLKIEGYALPGYIHQSIVEEVGKEAAVSEAEVTDEVSSDVIYKYRAGLGVGLASLSERNYSSGIKFSGNFYYKITEKVNLEFLIQTFQSSVSEDPERLGEGKLTVFPIHLSVQGRFPIERQLIPYATGGIGYYLNKYLFEGIKIPERDEKVRNALGFHFGGGIDYFFQEKIAANFDLRYCIVKTSGLLTFMGAGEDIEIEDVNLNSFMLGIGFKYFF